MFFFIGGVQPKTVTVDDTPRLCSSCGLAQARLKRVDHYLSLFFIPLIPLKRGEPVLMCNRCGVVSSPEEPLRVHAPSAGKEKCPSCGARIEPSFEYCPHCGVRL